MIVVSMVTCLQKYSTSEAHLVTRLSDRNELNPSVVGDHGGDNDIHGCPPYGSGRALIGASGSYRG